MNVLLYRHADRLPAVHFGYWPELLDEWAEQGHVTKELANAAKNDSSPLQRELDKIIGWDCNWYNTYSPSLDLSPRFERKVLEVFPDGTRRIQNHYGAIERIKPGTETYSDCRQSAAASFLRKLRIRKYF